MTVKESKRSELLAEIAAISGVMAGNHGENINADFLRRWTQRQLQDLAKRLSISGYSRLNKDALATRLWVEVEPVLDGHNESPPQERADMKANPEANVLSSPGAGSGSSLESRQTDRGLPGREIPVSHRFEESAHTPAVVREADILPKEIPWGYGHDRVTAMPVDPERLFVYWEVREESIAEARTHLGAGGPTAWLNVRLYDTSGRIFDGTNAHSNIDQRVERETRQWFFDIGKPTSELIAEVGLLSNEGYFWKIARSGRVEFPRREPAAWSEPEWMTVRASTGHVERSDVRSQVKSTGSAVPGAQAPPGLEGLPGWLLKHVEWQDVARFAQGGPGGLGVEERVEWEELHTDGTLAVHRRISWESPTMITSWESGPFAYPVEVPLPVREAFVGKTRVFKLGDRTHIVYGPWQVVIRGMAAHQSRAVLARWEVFRSWQTSSTHVVQSFASTVSGSGSGASERSYRGSSEMAYLGSSGLRFGGSSELYRLGASELRLGGASEMLFGAASENIFRGSSERRFAGASESRLMGGSESRLIGGSEGRLAAGSEHRLAGTPHDYPILSPSSGSSSGSSSGPSGNG